MTEKGEALSKFLKSSIILQSEILYQWNIIQTRLGEEQKVSFNLNRKNIEHYCPLITRQPITIKSGKITSVPLFPSYIFVYVDENLLAKAIKIKGVTNCMYWLNRPAVISAEEIKVIRKLLDENRIIKIQRSQMKLQRSVDMTFHPKEIFSEGNANLVKVILPSLGYCLIGEVNYSFKMMDVVKDVLI